MDSARVEQKRVNGNQLTTTKDVKQNYTRFFPNMAATYRWTEKQVSRFSYGRRINRPDYELLNPFRYYVDAFVFFEGGG